MNQARSEELGLTGVKFSDEKLFKPMNKAMCEMLPKLQYGWEEYTTESGGKVMRHIYSNQNTYKRELSQLSPLLKKGDTAYMLPELKENTSRNCKNFNNPDSVIGGKFVELKKQEKGSNLLNFIENSLKEASEQMAETLVLAPSSFTQNDFFRKLNSKWNKSIPKEIIIQWRGENYNINKQNWREIIADIKAQ